jgi:hypothetical protein
MDLQNKISVAGIDLKESHLRILKFIISYYLKDKLYFTPEKNSTIKIAEIPLDNIHEKLEEYKKQFPDSFFILISNSNSNIICNTAVTIQTPISPRKLLDTLNNSLLKLKNADATKNRILFKKNKVNEKIKKLIITQAERKIGKEKHYKSFSNLDKKLESNKKTNKLVTTQEKRENNKKKHDNSSSILDKKLENKKKINKLATTQEKRENNKKKHGNLPSNPDKKLENKKKINKLVTTQEKRDSNKKKDCKTSSDLNKKLEKNTTSIINKKIKNTSIITSKLKEQKPNKSSAKKEKNKQITIDNNHSSFTSSRPDINLSDLESLSTISYKTDDYFQEKLINVYNSPAINCLKTAYCSVIYNKKNHTVYVDTNDRILQNVSSIATLNVDYSITEIKHLSNNNKVVLWEDADAVLWKVSIWASRGRLPLLFNDIDREFTLSYWPNLTRFMMTPHAIEIAALWSKKPTSLRKSLILLNIPQRYIFSFYSAAIALDLIIFKKEHNASLAFSSTTESSSVQTPPKRKSVFNKLLNFFKPNNIEDI